MNFTIIKAKISHLSDIQMLSQKLFELEHKNCDPSLNLEWSFGEKGTEYFTKKIIENDNITFLASIDGNAVGYICGGILSDDSDSHILKNPNSKRAELDNIMVLEEYRNERIGKLLYAKFVEWCRGRDVGKIKVSVFSKNTKALNFYEKNGFTPYSSVLKMDI